MAVLPVTIVCWESNFGEERRREEEEGSIGDLKFESDVSLCSVHIALKPANGICAQSRDIFHPSSHVPA